MKRKWNKAASCSGKHRYQTPQMAWAVAAKSRKFAMKSYRCGHCGLFHVSGADLS